MPPRTINIPKNVSKRMTFVPLLYDNERMTCKPTITVGLFGLEKDDRHSACPIACWISESKEAATTAIVPAASAICARTSVNVRRGALEHATGQLARAPAAHGEAAPFTFPCGVMNDARVINCPGIWGFVFVAYCDSH